MIDSGNKVGFAFLVAQVTPQRSVLLWGLFLMLAQSAASLAVPQLAGRFTDTMLTGGEPGRILLIWLAVVVAQSALSFGNGYLLGRAGAEILARMSERLYDHLQVIPLAWFHERPRGEVLALLTTDINRLGGFVTGTLVRSLPQLVTFFGARGMIYFVDSVIALAVLVVLPLFFVALKFATRSLRPLSSKLVRTQAVQIGIAEQNLFLLPVIKSFVREGHESKRFREQTRRVLTLERRHLLMVQLLSPVTRILLTTGLVVLLWVASAKVAAGVMAPGDLVRLLLYGMLMSWPLASLANVYGEIQTVRGAAERVLDVFSVQPEPYQEDKPAMPPIRGAVRFEGLWFRYRGRDELLRGMSLDIRPGETIALTGPNGSGKSTLAHLLIRLIEPDRGRILIDGIDISQVELTSLRRQIGLIDQSVLLLNGTVAENIAYGRLDAAPQALTAAAKAAHAHEFIAALPDGYQTLIGDQGVKLSGGQKQRVALARALLKDPAILIMDEATSMFDPEGEMAFIRECHEVLQSRTVILITHRPESLKLADRIYRLDRGGLSVAVS